MKAVPSQFGPLGRVRPAPSVAPECAWTVIHQGSQAGAADVLLTAWTHDIATVFAVSTVSNVSTFTTVTADAQDSTALPPTRPSRRNPAVAAAGRSVSWYAWAFCAMACVP